MPTAKQPLLYTRKYSLPFYFRPFRTCYEQANYKLGKFQSVKLSLLKHNCTCVCVNSRRGETACEEERKLHGAKITPLYSDQLPVILLPVLFIPQLT